METQVAAQSWVGKAELGFRPEVELMETRVYLASA